MSKEVWLNVNAVISKSDNHIGFREANGYNALWFVVDNNGVIQTSDSDMGELMKKFLQNVFSNVTITIKDVP